MARRLSAHERALWSRVAATIRPLGGRPPAEVPPAPAILPPAPAPAQPRRAAVAARTPAAAAKPPRTPVTAATLDGSWDKRLRQGDISPDRIIDLHGYTLDAAHQRLEMALGDAAMAGERILLIITGKGRANRPGLIRSELSHWLERTSFRSRVAALRAAHPRHGGSGAFYLILRRQIR